MQFVSRFDNLNLSSFNNSRTTLSIVRANLILKGTNPVLKDQSLSLKLKLKGSAKVILKLELFPFRPDTGQSTGAETKLLIRKMDIEQ